MSYFAQIAAAYRERSGYRDRGTAILASGSTQHTARFVTRFMQPGCFRFDAEDSTLGRLVISCIDGRVRWWVSRDSRPSDSRDLEMAMLELPEKHPDFYFSAAGYVLSLVPPLLLPMFDKGTQGRLGVVRDWRVGEEAVLGGNACVAIVGVQHVDLSGLAELPQPLKGPARPALQAIQMTLTVDRAGHLIRRITAEDTPAGPWELRKLTVDYSPAFGETIDAAEFVLTD